MKPKTDPVAHSVVSHMSITWMDNGRRQRLDTFAFSGEVIRRCTDYLTRQGIQYQAAITTPHVVWMN
jgi:hypothetical protein